jgi:hypothetical protein
MYLLLKLINSLIKTAYFCVEYSKRRTIDFKSILCAINIRIEN